VRDSLSALDQAIACCGTELKAAEVRGLLGAFSLDSLHQVTQALPPARNSKSPKTSTSVELCRVAACRRGMAWPSPKQDPPNRRRIFQNRDRNPALQAHLPGIQIVQKVSTSVESCRATARPLCSHPSSRPEGPTVERRVSSRAFKDFDEMSRP
jgi:hypothetical protein